MRSTWNRWVLACSSAVTLTRTRVAFVGQDGRVVKNDAGAFVQGDNTTALAAAGAIANHPPQVACAITLQSAAAGATGRGRFYIPMPDFGAVGADLRMAVATRNSLRDNAQAFINEINAWFEPDPSARKRVCIASGGSISRNVPPALRPVETVRVGRVLDTIQRRRNRLDEEYSSAPIA